MDFFRLKEAPESNLCYIPVTSFLWVLYLDGSRVNVDVFYVHFLFPLFSEINASSACMLNELLYLSFSFITNFFLSSNL